MKLCAALLDQGVALEDPARHTYLNFFISGIQYITDPNIILKIVEDALTNIKKGNPDLAISYLYYFNQNVFYKNAKAVGIPLSLKILIDETIEALTQSRDDLIFVIGNIHVLLSDEQKVRIIEILQSFDFRM